MNGIKIIAILGDLSHSQQEKLDSGAEMFLNKPIDFAKLLGICNNIVKTPS